MRISDWSSDVCSSDLVTPDFTSSFSANYERVRDGGLASYEVAKPALPAAYYPLDLDQPRAAAQNIDGFRNRNAFSFIATQNYRGEALGFKSITAYSGSSNHTFYDVDGTTLPIPSQQHIDRYRQVSKIGRA